MFVTKASGSSDPGHEFTGLSFISILINPVLLKRINSMSKNVISRYLGECFTFQT